MKRLFALLTALILVFGFALSAYATGGDGSLSDTPAPTPDGSTPDPVTPATAGDITVTVSGATVSATHIFIPVTVANGGDEDVTLESVFNKTANLSVGTDASSPLPMTVPAGSTKELLLTDTHSGGNSGTVTRTLVFAFKAALGGSFSKYENVSVTFGIEAGGESTEPTESEVPFRLSFYDANGEYVYAPSGDAGEKVLVRIPLLCLRSNVKDVTLTPVLSTSLDSFPFEITTLDYTQELTSTPMKGDIVEFRYSGFRFHEMVTAGVKKVDFTLSWKDTWASDEQPHTATLSIYVNVIDGYTGAQGPDGSAPVSKPKVILDSYSISTDKIYAGEQFDVEFTLRNTSSEEAVQNIQISISDTAEVGKLMPANNGSNTLYIAKIGKGETHTEKISLQSAPDTEAKAYTLQLDFSYEGASNVASYTATETIAIPILQRIRLKVDDPTVYDEPWVGQSCAIYFALYNMGKAPIYNCMVDVEGEGLAMEETYFGGTVAAGSTLRADFSIIPSVAGEVNGEIVITYEDVYGEQMEERLPLPLYVNEEMMMDDPNMMFDPEMGIMGDDIGMMEPGMEAMAGNEGGFPVWAWIAIGAAVAAAAAVTVILLKKKRSKELEEA
ncbi:MAG: hypothetical protein IJB22_06465 [Clostridia bacterium]|nr:hypothetical protein [Clostridia bacterium]